MQGFSLHVRNLRALRVLDWSPPALSALVGANGAGKTTLVLCLKFLRTAFDRGPETALALVLDGAHDLRNWAAGEDELVELGLDAGGSSWRLQLGTVGSPTGVTLGEKLTAGGVTVFETGPAGLSYDRLTNVRVPAGSLALKHILSLRPDDERLAPVASAMGRITAFHDPDIWRLRTNGSSTKEDRHVQSRGSNALAMLRRWHQQRPDRYRYTFVIDTLKSAFPTLVEDLDFEEAGTTVSARIFAPGQELPRKLAYQANGIFSLLVTATELAGVEDGGVVAIDEPEAALHPYAIRRLIARAMAWADAHDVTVVLATHSTALLDGLTPEQVYVLRPGQLKAPTRVDEIRNRAWLDQYRLGQVYEEGEIGSNADEALSEDP
jgi:energy-coupling factor transporter ATP-binding protein EcfA2